MARDGGFRDDEAEAGSSSSDDGSSTDSSSSDEEVVAKPPSAPRPLAPSPPVLTEEQQAVVDAVLGMPPGGVAMLTGGAGVGKSLTTLAIYQALVGKGVNVVTAAPTGVAAANIGGVTLHSAMALSVDLGKAVEAAYRTESAADMVDARATMVKRVNKFAIAKMREYGYLILDEASMLAPWLYDVISDIGKRAKGNSTLPFGGMRVVMVADMAQLPPVHEGGQRGDLPPVLITHRPFLRDVPPHLFFNLTRVFRQADASFADLLNRMRLGKLTEEDARLLHSRVGAKLAIDKPPRLFPRNASAREVNMAELARLPGKARTYAIFSRRAPRVECRDRRRIPRTDIWECAKHPCRDGVCYGPTQSKPYLESDYAGARFGDKIDAEKLAGVETALLKSLRTRTDEVPLKLGSAVMLLANLAVPHFVNGSVGKVVGFSRLHADAMKDYEAKVEAAKAAGKDPKGIPAPITPTPMTALDTPACNTAQERVAWLDMERPIVEFTLRDGSKRTLDVPFVRYDSCHPVNGIAWAWTCPLMLGNALSIHKAQSATMPFVSASLGADIFAPGQAYVAVSRATSLEGLSLESFDPCSVVADPRAVEFYSTPYAEYRAKMLAAPGAQRTIGDVLKASVASASATSARSAPSASSRPPAMPPQPKRPRAVAVDEEPSAEEMAEMMRLAAAAEGGEEY
jgi:ATP-dependent DNA helicase PIF1